MDRVHLALFYPDQDIPVPVEYAEFLLCREMGWDFNQLEAQPAYRIAQAYAFLQEEGKARKFHEQRG